MFKYALFPLFVLELVVDLLALVVLRVRDALLLPPRWPHRLLRLLLAVYRLDSWRNAGWSWDTYRYWRSARGYSIDVWSIPSYRARFLRPNQRRPM